MTVLQTESYRYIYLMNELLSLNFKTFTEVRMNIQQAEHESEVFNSYFLIQYKATS